METTLYRKYRPQNFKEIKGQEHIVSVLENEAKTGKISHAYLFSGSRGTGKTSVARIFAKALGVSSEDVYEMDAASNRGIDEIREIRDAVHTYPYSSKYKVYIMDEAHMLTKEAWNAFLKTLEEPPEHVIFIMATTEQHKLPDTVVSRCECFVFKKPTHQILVESILMVAKEEKYEIEKKSANLIATLADGSFRDALSVLQKIINSSKDKKLSHEEVQKVLGAPKESYVLEILDAIKDGSAEKGIGSIRKASEENADMQVFLKMILHSLRFVLLLRFAPDMKKLVIDETGEEEFEKLAEIAKTAKNVNSKTLLAFLEAYSRQVYATIPELPIELAIIDSCTFENK
ncbi:MAG: DNA polymerase III, subunit gamma and tau [Candidatus Zambryskibacteria bacterium RIFOXYC1_FULL_39_10]|uniref:DNA polymerase III subunit gamma/tau n=1 Tax=Candidatus Zambryskibacteria bacterium RIFOXYC1_FULL_39_10 TaxID=1802779 RepID=A0A1G2UZ80_9BACT|nr:MAG: DNA polymerase III, subunit gamma and tau [Candidatus Zambryskibacteria bacterium RIFOXYC1_FULL_39_10]OHB15641.1 MAG: DNA polymerase III, subunit gamma and tau [Candidatus Zambryskibacteria bacterium RIFOXYD1_FULL_39_35]